MPAKKTQKSALSALVLGGLLFVGAGCEPRDAQQVSDAAPKPKSEIKTPSEEAAEPIVAEVAEAAAPSVAPSPAPVPVPTPVVTPAPAKKPAAHAYKDGTYTADGDYTYHSGSERITLTVTLKNDVIADTKLSYVPTNKMSERFMGMFAGGYREMVVGHNIAEVQLDKVSGSSRTPIGFNDAIEKIKAKAKS